MRYLMILVALLFVSTANASNSTEYEYFDGPVKVTQFKENAEGMITEGFIVRDKNDKYTLACKVKNGTPAIIRSSDTFVEELTKKPKQYLANPRGSTFTSLQWSEICQRMVK